MGQQAAGFTVIKIDPNVGVTSQVWASDPTSNFPTAAFRSRDGRIYVGAAYSGYLYCYDPKNECLEKLGAINLPVDTFPCNIDEDTEGLIWIGCYGSAGLTSYNPETGEFTHHGRMDNIDMYCYPRVGSQGTVCCEIKVTRPHVVVYEPKTGIRRNVGPMVTREDGGSVSLYRALDGELYIRSTGGGYKLSGFEIEPLESLPDEAPPLAMSDGSFADFSDRDTQMFQVLEIKGNVSGEVKKLSLNYEKSGSEIFLIHTGPDGNLYGSSILPLHLFRFIPSTHTMEDLGICSTASGEAYSMANMDGMLYICTYPGAMLSVYDPSRVYQFGLELGSNPRELGRMDEISYRPRSMIAGPLGRVWTASIPDYGLWGGPLSWYDPTTKKFGTYKGIAGEASCWSLAWLVGQNLLAVGTTISGGTGTQPRVDQAKLFLWDYTKEEKVWESQLPVSATEINSLIVAQDNLLYGTAVCKTASFFFIFDPNARDFVHMVPVPVGHALDLGLQIGPSGDVYGFTSDCFYRFDLISRSFDLLHEERGIFQKPGPMDNGGVYFTKKHELKKIMFDK